MQDYHYRMAAAVLIALAVCAWKRDPLAALFVALSIIPFIAGSATEIITGRPPVEVNLIADVALAAVFVALAHVVGGLTAIVLCLIMLTMAVIDVSAMYWGNRFYLELHLALHYLALIAGMGRQYGERVLGNIGNISNSVSGG